MPSTLLWFFVFYFLVVFVGLLGVFWQDSRFFFLAGINFVALLLFFLVSFFINKKEKLIKSKSEEPTVSDKIRYPKQFMKYPYHKNTKKSLLVFGYILFFSLFLFLFSVIDLTLIHKLGDVAWVFPLLYLFSLFFAGKNLIEHKIKIFGYNFGFYFFLFVSSIIVGLLVYGTLFFSILPFLLLSAFLISFLFFFVGYLFVKNQGLRFFFGLWYTKIYIVILLIFAVWSIFASNVLPSKGVAVNTFNRIVSVFVLSNEEPLLLESEGQVVSSGTIESTGTTLEDMYEETGHVVSGGINPVFVTQDSSGVVEEEIEPVILKNTKSDLNIKDTDTIQMLTSLQFLIDENDIPLSTKTDTRFTYVSKTNPLYPYWKTAYDNRMIGSSTNPSTKISCETYQVFKGMLLGWDLEYSSANVKKVFWDEATKQDVLNGCEYGKLLKGENL